MSIWDLAGFWLLFSLGAFTFLNVFAGPVWLHPSFIVSLRNAVACLASGKKCHAEGLYTNRAPFTTKQQVKATVFLTIIRAAKLMLHHTHSSLTVVTSLRHFVFWAVQQLLPSCPQFHLFASHNERGGIYSDRRRCLTGSGSSKKSSRGYRHFTWDMEKDENNNRPLSTKFSLKKSVGLFSIQSLWITTTHTWYFKCVVLKVLPIPVPSIRR